MIYSVDNDKQLIHLSTNDLSVDRLTNAFRKSRNSLNFIKNFVKNK
jgi:hypothetical protein